LKYNLVDRIGRFLIKEKNPRALRVVCLVVFHLVTQLEDEAPPRFLFSLVQVARAAAVGPAHTSKQVEGVKDPEDPVTAGNQVVDQIGQRDCGSVTGDDFDRYQGTGCDQIEQEVLDPCHDESHDSTPGDSPHETEHNFSFLARLFEAEAKVVLDFVITTHVVVDEALTPETRVAYGCVEVLADPGQIIKRMTATNIMKTNSTSVLFSGLTNQLG
jgi:hypothetical protein